VPQRDAKLVNSRLPSEGWIFLQQSLEKRAHQPSITLHALWQDQFESVQAKSSRLATPTGLKSNYKVLRAQTESTTPIASKGLSGALATPGTDPPPIKHEKAAHDCDSGRGAQTSMEEGQTSKHKNSLPSPNLQAYAALKTEAPPSEPGAAHG
jgi:hypothetical protein